jgi:REP element-mobilizing transposase RayT
MPHSFTSLLVHVVFSTKDRVSDLSPGLATRLFPYMAGIVRERKGVPLIINGPADHVHLLVYVPAKESIADLLRVVKTIRRAGYTNSFQSADASVGRPDTPPSP